LIRLFVAHPQDLDTIDASCAPAVPPIHAVGSYPVGLAEVSPIQPAPGSSASSEALRLAAAAVQTAGDAVARYQATEASRDRGLHGGSVTVAKGGRLLTLSGEQLIGGIAVSGTLALAPAPLAADGETVVATLSVTSAAAPPSRAGHAPASPATSATFTATWTTSGAGAVARVAGNVAGVAVSGTLPAP
jgi:hypothetical protein